MFDTGKVCLWEIIVTPQSLVLSCCDMNNNHGGKNIYCLEMGMVIVVGVVCRHNQNP